ncbi:16S rRNA (uracil(1498)-N(3))-methyltransferase [Crossiella sp. SN42]|uniref:16S rRNA (uracil(1498)-N(3))-methyltransferase n=1 Tax=Crossiella sp. SN42 TaxID=2944808 RepID=UPI00207D1518|nr:16S rRNA (uracil(1498)-N(3))-methyltransferase [Crossiella sp. SN42]MCO1577612.1 16S rRNA (uracil(1498)-N(3))-methyltransferase [Crossiella sp. SN42]
MHGDAVFHVDELPSGDSARLDGPEGRHAATVRRMRVGEHLVLSDGAGGLARCAVTEVGKDFLGLEVLARRLEPAPSPRVTLVQALVKGDRGELAVELATEAGVDAVHPWRAARCVARWEDGPRGAKALARWRSTALQAAKQARRAWVPEVGEPLGTGQLTQLVKDSARTLVLHEAAEVGLAEVELPAEGELLIVVGPEGGITESEIARLTESGAVPVRLGHTVLRASTAAAVALGALGVLTGRWAAGGGSGESAR